MNFKMRDNRQGWQEWLSNPSRPSYGNKVEMDRLADNFWGTGKRRMFVNGLLDRDFKYHEISYIKGKGRPRDESIVEEVIDL